MDFLGVRQIRGHGYQSGLTAVESIVLGIDIVGEGSHNTR